MAQAALRHIVFSLAMAGLLMGCVEGSGSDAGAPKTLPASDRPGAGNSGTGRDIEAPEVFLTTDTALWDGRPSLGGIWVASPEAKDPERVVMFNPATGKSVNGALFRRERDNPGPTLQMSSDAAEALGMLAGQPTQIRVTALRRQEVKATAAPAEPAPAAPAESGATGTDAAATAAATTTALAATGAGRAAASPEPRPAALTDTAADADGVATAAPAAEEPPARKTWKERRAEAKAARDAKKAAAAAAAGAKTAEPEATAESVGVTAVETAPLDAGAAVAADDRAKTETAKTRRQKQAEAKAAAAQAATAPVATEAEPPAAPAASGGQIQVASFSQEQNAQRAIEALAKIGVSAQLRKSETGGKVVWGVVAMGDQTTLSAIKSAGFADAYFLK